MEQTHGIGDVAPNGHICLERKMEYSINNFQVLVFKIKSYFQSVESLISTLKYLFSIKTKIAINKCLFMYKIWIFSFYTWIL